MRIPARPADTDADAERVQGRVAAPSAHRTATATRVFDDDYGRGRRTARACARAAAGPPQGLGPTLRRIALRRRRRGRLARRFRTPGFHAGQSHDRLPSWSRLSDPSRWRSRPLRALLPRWLGRELGARNRPRQPRRRCGALCPEHVDSAIARLETDYYVPVDCLRSAVVRYSLCNFIHLATMFKIDLFVSKGRPYDREAAARASPQALDEKPGA